MMNTGVLGALRRASFGLVLFTLFGAGITAQAVSSVTLAWDPSSDPTVAGYNIYYGTASRTYTNVVSVTTTNAATISGLVPAVTYYFAATAYTASGLESEFSTEAYYTVPSTNPVSGEYCSVGVGSTVVRSGQSASVPLYADSSSGLTNLAFTITWSGARFTSPALSGAAAGVSLRNQTTNLLIRLRSAAQPVSGLTMLAQLNFQTISNQSSAFVTLPLAVQTANKPNGQSYTNYFLQPGRVTVVNDLPLLEADLVAPANRSLTVFAQTGAVYQIQYSLNSSGPYTWSPLLSYTQTNLVQSLGVDSSNPLVFYRVYKP